jgi:hypothetical protein
MLAEIPTAPSVSQSPPKVSATKPINKQSTSAQLGKLENGRLRIASAMINTE